MTQCERLLDFLEDGQKITPLESWQSLGIYRLAARVFDLRAAGHDIEKRMVKVKNRYGEAVKVAQYELVPSKGQLELRL